MLRIRNCNKSHFQLIKPAEAVLEYNYLQIYPVGC